MTQRHKPGQEIPTVTGQTALLDPALEEAFEEDPFFSEDPGLLEELAALEEDGVLSQEGAPISRDEAPIEATAMFALPDFGPEDGEEEGWGEALEEEEVEEASLEELGLEDAEFEADELLEVAHTVQVAPLGAWDEQTPRTFEAPPVEGARDRTAVEAAPARARDQTEIVLLGQDFEEIEPEEAPAEAPDQTVMRGQIPSMALHALRRSQERRELALWELREEAVGAPWGRLLVELRAEAQAPREAGARASLLHELAELLRLGGPRWAAQVRALEEEALALWPGHAPAALSLLVDDALEGLPWGEALAAALARLGQGRAPESARLVGALRLGLALRREVEGAAAEARRLYAAAAEEPDAFGALNQARLALAQGDAAGYARALGRCAALAGDGPEADAQRALLLEEGAEALRRAGLLPQAAALLREAIAVDPTSISGYRGLQVVAWQTRDPALEIEGLRGQLALLVEQGRDLRRADPRRKILRRKTAARFFRLGQLLRGQGALEEARAALLDALSVYRHELLYLRALEQLGHEEGDLEGVEESLTRQVGLIVDTSLQALLLVDQAHVRLARGDAAGCGALLSRSLELAPGCLPARISLGRLYLAQGRWEALLALRDGGLEGERPDPLLEQAPARAAEAWRRGEIAELMLGDAERALEEYRQALRWQATPGPWLAGAERLLMRQWRWGELASAYLEALQGAREQARLDLLRRSARLAALRGEVTSAARALSELVGVGEAPSHTLEEAARWLALAGEREEAAALWERLRDQASAHRALQGDPALIEVELRALRWLARLYEGPLGDAEAARACREQVLALCPGDAESLERLRAALARQGAWSELAAALEAQAQAAPQGRARRDLWLEAAGIHQRRLRGRRRALEIIEELLAQSPDDHTVADRYEEALRESNEVEALVEALEARARRAGGADPEQGARCWLEAALLRRDALGDAEGAIQGFQAVTALAPGQEMAWRAAADLLRRAGRDLALVAHYARWRGVARAEARAALCAEAAEVLELRLRDLPGAEALRAEAVALDPADTDSWRALARLRGALGLRGAQIEALDALAGRTQDAAEEVALRARAAALVERRGESASARWREVLALDPRHGGARLGLERALRREGAHAELLKHYLDCARHSVGQGRVPSLLQIATVYEEMGRPTDAAEILRKVLEVEPTCALARLWLSENLTRAGKLPEAAALERALADSSPDDAQRLIHLARAASCSPEQAQGLWWEVLRLDPGHERAFAALRGPCLREGGQALERLLGLVERRLEGAQGEGRVALLREAAALSQPLDPERAAEHLEALLALAPEDAEALERAAALAEDRGQHRDAVRLMTQWLALEAHREHPQRAQALLRAATLLHHALGDGEAAAALLEELLARAPQHRLGRLLMADVRLAQGMSAQACELLKDLFEEEVTAALALRVAQVLEQRLGRSQEALTWYMRAQDLEPLNGEALSGFVGLIERQGASESRLLRDRLDWLVEAARSALDEDPWDLGRLAQLAQLHALRGDEAAREAVVDVLRYFGVAGEQEAAPAPLLQPRGALSEEDVRRCVLPPAARGSRRQIYGLVWESLAAVEPDDLKAWGVRRGNRVTERDSPLVASVVGLLAALRVPEVEIFLHPGEPWAVTPLLLPEPALILGQGLQGRLQEPFHLFRVARVLELLREGKLLTERPNAAALMGGLDHFLGTICEGSPQLPLFSSAEEARWGREGAQRLHRQFPRRLRRDLKLALEERPEPGQGPSEAWAPACQQAAARVGLVICGSFGAAADAISGRRFSLERAPNRAAEMIAALRQGEGAALLTGLLRFAVSEDCAALRRRLRGQGEEAR